MMTRRYVRNRQLNVPSGVVARVVRLARAVDRGRARVTRQRVGASDGGARLLVMAVRVGEERPVADADERDGFATRNSVEQRRQVCGIAKRDHGRVEQVQRRYCKHVARAHAGKRGGAQSIS